MGEQEHMSEPFLTGMDLTLSISDRPVLRGVSFTLEKGKRLVISGETGAGKSSLLRIVAGLLQPDSGAVMLKGRRVEGPDEKLVPGHSAIAYLSQHFELPKFLRVDQILKYANALTDDSAGTLYQLCQVDHLLQRRTDELSGGEKQRIALARLLITSPSLLLLDEPFSHLDMDHKNILKKVVADVSAALDMTCVMVSHHPEDTLPWADRILVLKEGVVIQQGSPREIYSRPSSEYVAGLFGNYNLVREGNVTLLLRPEQIVVHHDDSGPFKGRVREVLFFGSHTIAEVENEAGGVLRIKVANHQPVKKNECVSLSWPEGGAVRLSMPHS